jgi:hypothetical protein
MKFFKLIAHVISFFFVSDLAFADASVITTLSAKVAAPISISQTSGLNFGSFAAGTTSGTITQAGIATGGVTAVAGGETRSAGIFAVTGEALGTGTIPYTFTMPTSVTLTSGTNSMTATLSFDSGSSSRTLNSAGSETVTVNSTLSVAASQAAGYYSGIYSVTVAY